MQVAIVAAGFKPAEADELRRAMGTFKFTQGVNRFRDQVTKGMIANGYAPDYAERMFRQLEGFGSYGFPESHAASFALIAYASAWVKRHHPDAFLAALLNAQPMGFYAPAQLVRDAREHGVIVRPPCVNASGWDAGLEPPDPGESDAPRGGRPVGDAPRLAVRLGFASIKGFAEADARALVAERDRGGPYRSVDELHRRLAPPAGVLERLAAADALLALGRGLPPSEWSADYVRTGPGRSGSWARSGMGLRRSSASCARRRF